MENNCPKCHSENCYPDGNFWSCPECSHEWVPGETLETKAENPESGGVKDAYGNELKTGDTVTIIKDLKIKGASSTLKSGTKVKSIRLIDAVDGHNIACKIDGIGAINLKSEFVKKA